MKKALIVLLPVIIVSSARQGAAAVATSAAAGPPMVGPHLHPTDDRPLKKPQNRIAGSGQCPVLPGGVKIRAKPLTFSDTRVRVGYEPGKLYRVETLPNFLTVIALHAGEHIASKAAGDTLNWSIGETYEGKGGEARALILVKPHRSGLRTNLVITTDQRSYYVEISSLERGRYTSLMTWDYGDLATIRAPTAPPAAAGDDADRGAHLNFHYLVGPKRRKGPKWLPVRVFDDGQKTYIEFSDKAAAASSPPLFVIQPDGSDALVNYRVKDDYYVVDRLIAKAELRLGKNVEDSVTISAEPDHD